MARLPHGAVITLDAFREARADMTARSMAVPLAFAAASPGESQDFDFLFPKLQENPDNLLPTSRRTRDALARLGMSMRDTGGPGDSQIPAAYTYFGQFVDHDITLEAGSAELSQLIDPGLKPMPLDKIKESLRNVRSATLDLDSVYGLPAPRAGTKMQVGQVSDPGGGTGIPFLRPPDKDDFNDLPREPRHPTDPSHDRAALIGDPRNDENTVVAQLHTAFLLAHNKLADRLGTFREARRTLRQLYQHVVLHDFLPRICDPRIVKQTIKENRVYDAMAEPFFMPLEFSVAAYRFGHTMIRAEYDFNLNFNTNGPPAVPASLELLFTFTALSGQLGFGTTPTAGTDTLPFNWIIEWENFVDAGGPFQFARALDTKLVEPLFHLRQFTGVEEMGEGASLAARNLLRGYLLRMPTGQAVARTLRQKLGGPSSGISVLTPAQIEAAAASPEQAAALRDGGFLDRTPLWYYILAEAAVLGRGRHLGPVGSTLVAEILVGLCRRSEDSILRDKGFRPWPPSKPVHRNFDLADLLRLAGVLKGRSGGGTKKRGGSKKAGGSEKTGAAKKSGAAKKGSRGGSKKG